MGKEEVDVGTIVAKVLLGRTVPPPGTYYFYQCPVCGSERCYFNEKERLVEFNTYLVNQILQRKYNPLIKVTHRKTGRVFTYKGNSIGYRSKFLRTACRKAKVKTFTYHNLRHYGASKMDNANISLVDIQEVLGHEQITTTAIYIQSLKHSVKNAMKVLE